MLLVIGWVLNSNAQTSGGGPFTKGSNLNITDGIANGFPYKLNVSSGSLSCTGGVCTLNTGGASPAGSSGNLQTNNGSGGFGAYAGSSCSAGQAATSINASGAFTCSSAIGYWTLSSTNLYSPITDTVTVGTSSTSKDLFTANTDGTFGGGVTINFTNAQSATGGTITSSGGSEIHTFTTSGTFTPNFTGTVSVMAIGGGGAGGYIGGGASGGYRTNTTYSVTANAGITVTIGNGGSGTVGGLGNSGQASVFGTISAAGGGGGGGVNTSSAPTAGGSGGGGGQNDDGSNQSGAAGNTPSTSPSQGNNGGSSNHSGGTQLGGGGGGASGGVGVNAPGATTGGNGGPGTANTISGSSVTYACGGGGGAYLFGGTGTNGTGGCGSAGNGGKNGTTSTAASANSGSGGGGQGLTSAGGLQGASSGAGGSGIVIVSFSAANNPTLTYDSAGTQTAKSWTDGINGDRYTLTVGTTDVMTQTTTNQTLNTTFTLADGKNIITNTTTGSSFGNSTSQKTSVYGVTPVVQGGATTDLGTIMSNWGVRAPGTAYPVTTSGNKTFGDLSASQAVFTNGSSVLVSNAITGSGNVAMSASPTFTGSPLAPTQTANDNSTKIATTAYVDNAALAQNYKEAVRVATTANLVGLYLNGSSGVGATFTYTATGTDSIDGVTLALNDRVLLKNQTSDFQNGIYTVTTAGALGIAGILTRATDANQSAEYKTGDLVFVTAGTTLTSTTWAYTGIDSPTMGTISLTYVQIAGQGSFTGGNGITITGTSIAIDTSITVDKTTAQTLTNKTLTTPIISSISNSGTVTIPTGADTLVARTTTDTLTNKTLSYAVASGAGTYKGNIITLTSTETQAIGDAVQIDSSGQAHLAKADTLAHASGVLLAAAAVSGSGSNTYLLPGGTLKLSSSPSWTVGGLVYLSITGTTTNTLTQTAPSATDNSIEVLGVAVAADTILFIPSLSQVTHT